MLLPLHRSVAILLIATCLCFTIQASANTTFWQGLGGDDNWGTAANWTGNTTPSGGGSDILHFAGSSRLTPFNNYGTYSQFQQILFDSGAGAFTVSGNIIKLFDSGSGARIENNSSSTQTINFNPTGDGILTESATQFNPVSGNLVINGNIKADFNSGAISVNGNNGYKVTFNGVLGQYNTTGSLTVQQNSVAVLNAANTYTGATTVNAGTLLVNGSTSASSAVAVASGATLGGSGTVGGTVALNGTLSPGNVATVGSVGTLATGALTMTSTAGVLMDVNGLASFDKVNVSGAVTYAGTLTIDLGSYAPTGATTYQLFSASSQTGAFTNSAAVAFNQSGYTGTFNPVLGTLTITAVPEPATWFAGVLMLGTAGCLLRRRLRPVA